MIKLLMIALALFYVGLLAGCDNLPSWLNFGQPKVEETSSAPEEAPAAQDEGTLLASIKGRVITLEDFNERIDAYNKEIESSKDIPDSVRANYLIKNPEDKKRLLDGMVERELLVAEAISRGLDKDKDLLKAIEALKTQLLFSKMLEVEKAKASVSAKEVESYYNLYKDAFKVPEERKVSMIRVPGEDKAKEILIGLLQGADFAEAARVNSADPSAPSGGDIGFIVQKGALPQGTDKKTMFDKFEEVVFSLELNAPSAIFKGPDGFYIVKVTEIKASRQMPLVEVSKDIEQGLLLKKQEEALKSLIDNLQNSGNVVVHKELLK